jgi:hypothetical protein
MVAIVGYPNSPLNDYCCLENVKMIVTNEWIEEHKTTNGGWNKPQLEAIGIAWPPVKGWKLSVIGKQITERQRIQFESSRIR